MQKTRHKARAHACQKRTNHSNVNIYAVCYHNGANRTAKTYRAVNSHICDVENFKSYKEWLDKISLCSKKETLPEGRVLGTQFISVRKTDNKIIGFVNIRHELNDYLLKFGGHIGGSVRPSERRKGYSIEQLKLSFKFLENLGVNKVLITCKDWNIASKNSIIKSGGVFENTETDKDGNVLERYWITLNEGEKGNDN